MPLFYTSIKVILPGMHILEPNISVNDSADNTKAPILYGIKNNISRTAILDITETDQIK